MSYQAEPVPTDTPDALKRFLADELRKIANEFARANSIKSTGIEPVKRWNGMIVYAVDPWATTLGAEGFYGYQIGAWVALG